MGLIPSAFKGLITTTRQTIRDINTRYWGACTGFHALILVYTGFWPLAHNEKNLYLKCIKILPYMGLGGCVFTISISLYDIQFKLSNYVLLAEAFTFLITLTKTTIIMLIAFFKIQDIVSIFTKLDNLVPYIINAKEKAIFDRYQKMIVWYTSFVIVVYSGHALIFCVQPMFEAERRYPMHYTLPVESPLYEIIYIGALLIGVGSMMILSTADALIISGFMCVNGYLEILQVKLEHVKEFAEKRVTKQVVCSQVTSMREMLCGGYGYGMDVVEMEQEEGGDIIDLNTAEGEGAEATMTRKIEEGQTNVDMRDVDDEMRRHLVYCAEFYEEILRIVQEMQEKEDPVLFIELISGALGLCMGMFVTYMVPLDSIEMVLWLGIVAILFEELYGICWVSSELSEKSVEVSDALYFSDWTEASPSYKRSMLIMMSRAVSPLKISTGSFLTFDMEMFTNVLNTAYSYFNMITQLNASK